MRAAGSLPILKIGVASTWRFVRRIRFTWDPPEIKSYVTRQAVGDRPADVNEEAKFARAGPSEGQNDTHVVTQHERRTATPRGVSSAATNPQTQGSTLMDQDVFAKLPSAPKTRDPEAFIEKPRRGLGKAGHRRKARDLVPWSILWRLSVRVRPVCSSSGGAELETGRSGSPQ